jgi:hypothetical protein
MIHLSPRNLVTKSMTESPPVSILSTLRSSTLELIHPYFDKDSAQIILQYLFVRREWPTLDLPTLGQIDYLLVEEMLSQNHNDNCVKSHIIHLDRNRYRIGSHTIDGKPILGYFPHSVRSVYYAEYVDLEPGCYSTTDEHWKLFVQLQCPDTPHPYFAVIIASGNHGDGWESFDLTCYISTSFDTAMEEFFRHDSPIISPEQEYTFPPLNETYMMQRK